MVMVVVERFLGRFEPNFSERKPLHFVEVLGYVPSFFLLEMNENVR